MNTTLYSPAAAVDAGVTVLDQLHPGWRDVIDPDSLDLANGEFCILGQLGHEMGLEPEGPGPLFNTYLVTAAHFAALDGAIADDSDVAGVREWGRERGFCTPLFAAHTDYDELEIEWRNRLQEDK